MADASGIQVLRSAVPVCGLALCAALCAAAPTPGPVAAAVPLARAAARRPPQFTPAMEGQTITVEGRVAARPIVFRDYAHLAIEDGDSALVLESAIGRFEGLTPGNRIRARGVLTHRAGLPVLRPSQLEPVSPGSAPRPLEVDGAELQGFRYLGRLVTTEGDFVLSGSNAGGYYLLIGNPAAPLKVFLPFASLAPRREPWHFTSRDHVRVTGIASQYCSVPPYDTGFQLLIGSASDVALDRRAPPVRPRQAAVLILLAAALAALWWRRERHIRAQRLLLRSVFALSEEALGASSASEISRRVAAVLPRLMRLNAARLYVYRRGAKALEWIPPDDETPDSETAAHQPVPSDSAVAVCFQNRTLLAVPDVSRSPFAGRPRSHSGTDGTPPAESASVSGWGWHRRYALLLAPLLAQGEAEGVLEIELGAGRRSPGPVEREIVQHLANQIGLALKLLDQRSIREQLFRSEKLAAVGQLMSGIANELEAPLVDISAKAATAMINRPNAPVMELRAIEAEAARALAMVARLVSFARPGHSETHPVDLFSLVRDLVNFREREWKARGIHASSHVPGAAVVTGSRGQLEQLVLNLIVHAEQSVTDLPERHISIDAKALAGRAMVEISFGAQAGSPDPFADGSAGSSFSVCRGIAAGHGGELRSERSSSGSLVFVLDLPCRVAARAGNRLSPRSPTSGLTVLSIEPEEISQRRLVELLSVRGLRVVPVSSPAEGLDLAQRLRFDLVFCSVSVTGIDYVEIVRRIQTRTGTLVLVSGVPPIEPPAACLLLTRPVEEDALDDVLDAAEARSSSANHSHV